MSEELFGDYGNYEDYWLGTAAYDNTRILEQDRWTSAETILRGMRRRELVEWDLRRDKDLSRDMLRKILANEPNAADRAGGIMDISPEFHNVRSRLIARGRLALEFESRRRK